VQAHPRSEKYRDRRHYATVSDGAATLTVYCIVMVGVCALLIIANVSLTLSALLRHLQDERV
jgi:hypothetical protein